MSLKWFRFPESSHVMLPICPLNNLCRLRFFSGNAVMLACRSYFLRLCGNAINDLWVINREKRILDWKWIERLPFGQVVCFCQNWRNRKDYSHKYWRWTCAKYFLNLINLLLLRLETKREKILGHYFLLKQIIPVILIILQLWVISFGT